MKLFSYPANRWDWPIHQIRRCLPYLMEGNPDELRDLADSMNRL